MVGSGPNGLAAAITVARAGLGVGVLEAEAIPGGGCRSAELTLPGFVHDVCATVPALAPASPFFQSLPLARLGVELVCPPAPLAHPFEDGTAAVLERSVEATAHGLGADGPAYLRLLGPLVRDHEQVLAGLLGPLRLPRHPRALAHFGLRALLPASGLARLAFRGAPARALFAGLSAHAMLPLSRPPTAAFGLVLAMAAHAHGWPFVRGGSQELTSALVAYLAELGGTLVTGRRVSSLKGLRASALLLDLTPRQVVEVAGGRLPSRYLSSLRRYRYGPAAFKLDWALSAPIPWTAEGCRRSGTVHLGGTWEEIATAEADVWAGRVPARPFTLVAQASRWDPSRAPVGAHTGWAYCHVPHGCTADLTELVEAQVERFAPGFGRLILGRAITTPAELERGNANHVGGDINGGVQDLSQLFARPAGWLDPYSTPDPRLFLCSSSTPPGGGVHGMCGYQAARSALRRILRPRRPA